MPRQNASPGCAQRLRRGDKFSVLQRKNLTSDDATEPEPAGESEEENQGADRELRPRDKDSEQQQKSWNCEESIEHAHHHTVYDSARVTGNRAVTDAQCETNECREKPDGER